MAIFRPTARVRIQLRLDELTETDAILRTLERDAPVGATQAVSAISATAARAALEANLQKRTQLESIRAAVPKPQLNRERSQLDQERQTLQRGPATEQQERPQGLVEQPNDERNVLFDMLPEEATVSRNGLQDSDTAEVTLSYQDLPIDPRVIRSALISIAIGTVSADDYEAGVTKLRVRETDGSLASMVERVPGEELQFNSASTFVGYVDEWMVEFTEEGDTVKLQCRDISALLRDQRLPEGWGLDMRVPIDMGIQELVNRFPSSRGLKVRYGTPRDPNDPLSDLVSTMDPPFPEDSIPEILKPQSKRGGQKKRTSTDESVWDHIMKTTQQLGLIPVFRGFTLFIMEPRVVFGDFLKGTRRMVWGRNLSKLAFARKLGGRKNDTIEVRCPDPSIGRTRWARYPVVGNEPRSGVLGLFGSPQPTTTRANNVSPNGMGSETVQVMTVAGVTDSAILERIAEASFEQMARQEIEGYFETEEIESFDSKHEGDLLTLQPGNPITVQIAPPIDLAPVESAAVSGQRSLGLQTGTERAASATSLQRLQAQSAARRQRYLEDLGMSPATARRLAAAQEQAALIETFRAGHVNISWSADDGVTIDCDFHNFVVVRDGAPNARGEALGAELAGGLSAGQLGLGAL